MQTLTAPAVILAASSLSLGLVSALVSVAMACYFVKWDALMRRYRREGLPVEAVIVEMDPAHREELVRELASDLERRMDGDPRRYGGGGDDRGQR